MFRWFKRWRQRRANKRTREVLEWYAKYGPIYDKNGD